MWLQTILIGTAIGGIKGPVNDDAKAYYELLSLAGVAGIRIFIPVIRGPIMTMNQRVHLITGGFPPGSAAGHDMDYARIQLLQCLQTKEHLAVTVANDFQDIERWLP